MRKLLSASIVRLWRDKVFWLCMLGMLVMNVFIILNGSRQATGAMAEYNYTLDRYYYNEAPLIGMFSAIIVGMFVGTEYYEGAVRNKLAVLTILVYIALLLAVSKIYSCLEEPATIAHTWLSQEGTIQMGEPEANPLYIGGTKRTIFEFLMDFLPTGQAILLSDAATTHPVRQLISSLAITVGTLVGDSWLFKKKDLK